MGAVEHIQVGLGKGLCDLAAFAVVGNVAQLQRVKIVIFRDDFGGIQSIGPGIAHPEQSTYLEILVDRFTHSFPSVFMIFFIINKYLTKCKGRSAVILAAQAA